MLTIALSRLLRFRDSSALPTECHVVQLHQIDLESGIFQIKQEFQFKVLLIRFTEIEEMMVA